MTDPVSYRIRFLPIHYASMDTVSSKSVRYLFGQGINLVVGQHVHYVDRMR
jgi:hypothetical protein